MDDFTVKDGNSIPHLIHQRDQPQCIKSPQWKAGFLNSRRTSGCGYASPTHGSNPIKKELKHAAHALVRLSNLLNWWNKSNSNLILDSWALIFKIEFRCPGLWIVQVGISGPKIWIKGMTETVINASPSELLENFLFFEKQNKVPLGDLVSDWAGQVSRSFMNRGANEER